MTSKFFGYNIPFLNGRTILPFQTDERLIKNDILQLLLTSPGERIMRPLFGSLINYSLFEQNTSDLIALIKEQIYDAILRFEPRVSIKPDDIVVKSDVSNDAVINISIKCNYNPQNFDDSFVISFNVNTSTGIIER